MSQGVSREAWLLSLFAIPSHKRRTIKISRRISRKSLDILYVFQWVHPISALPLKNVL